MSTVFEDAQSEAQLSSALGLANAEAAVSHHSRGKGDGDEARVPRGSDRSRSRPRQRPRAASAPRSDYASFGGSLRRAQAPTGDNQNVNANAHRPDILLRSRPLTVHTHADRHSPYGFTKGFPRKTSTSSSSSSSVSRSRSRSASRLGTPSEVAPGPSPTSPTKARQPFPLRPRTDSSPFARRGSSRASTGRRYASASHYPHAHPPGPPPQSPYVYSYPYGPDTQTLGPLVTEPRAPLTLHSPFRLRLVAFGIEEHDGLPHPVSSTTTSRTSRITLYLHAVISFLSLIFIALPHQLLLHLLFLRIPHIHFSRIVTFLEDSGLSADDLPLLLSRDTLIYSLPHLIHFRYAWDTFVDTLVREWKAQAVISALLVSALLSLVQLSTEYDPISRTLALLALLCALISLSFAALYIVNFGTGPCRRVVNAARLAQAVQNRQLTPSISMLWNPYMFLALPSIWFAWTVLLFTASLMVFVWRTYLSETSPTPSLDRRTNRLVAALLLCAVLVVAVIGLLLVLWTLSRWGVYHSERLAGWDESNKPEGAHAAPPATEKPSSPHRVWHTRYVPGPSSAPPNPHANGSSSYAFAHPGGTSDSPLPAGRPMPIPVVVPQGVPSVPSRGRSVRYNRRTTVVPGSGAQAVFPEPKAPAEFVPVKVLHVSPRKDGGLDISLATGTADSVVIGGGADSTGHDMRGDEMATFGEQLRSAVNASNLDSASPVPPFPLPVDLTTRLADAPQEVGARSEAFIYALQKMCTVIHSWNERFFRGRGLESVVVVRLGVGEDGGLAAQVWVLARGSSMREFDDSRELLAGGGTSVLVRVHESAEKGKDRYFCSTVELGTGP